MLARKPLVGTVAGSVAEHGTGALNIDGARIGTEGGTAGANGAGVAGVALGGGLNGFYGEPVPGLGRWPANVILDPEAAALLDLQAPDVGGGGGAPEMLRRPDSGIGFHMASGRGHDDSGGASRFFYCAKASRAEREAGLDGLPLTRRVDSESRDDEAAGSNNPRLRTSERRNHHPTVKPLALMRWLVRLVTPPGGLVLDPFTGSGTTGMACAIEGFRFLGMDLEPEYVEIARRRIAWAAAEPRAFDVEAEGDAEEPRQAVML